MTDGDPAEGLRLGIAHYLAGRWRDALDGLDDARRRAPFSPERRYLGGLCHYRLGRPGKGAALVSQSISLMPTIRNYDIVREFMLHQGMTSETALLERRFFDYLRFKTIDAFLISYPKCGRTWLRLMLARYLLGDREAGDPLDLQAVTRAEPALATVAVSHDDYPHWKPADRVGRNKMAYSGKKVLFLARDPRDAIVSNYFEDRHRTGTFFGSGDSENISKFIRRKVGGISNIVAFYNSWSENTKTPVDFKVVTYEDMHAQPEATIRECALFFGWPILDDARIREVANECRFEKMRTLEEQGKLGPVDIDFAAAKEAEAYKVRRGEVGGYTRYLTRADIDYVEDYLDGNLSDLFSCYRYRTR